MFLAPDAIDQAAAAAAAPPPWVGEEDKEVKVEVGKLLLMAKLRASPTHGWNILPR